ncbi:MAG TPA: signal peptidase I [Spirochaetia bacterium]|nr:signal peptidase I [Spirochaetia bacterium]
MKQTLRFPIVTLLLCAVFLWTVQGIGLTLVQVRGPSMVPSYADGQVLFVNRLAYGLQGPIIGEYLWIWKAPNFGDPVVVRRPDEGTWVVKRVAGLPGMDLKVEDHRLAVGGRSVALTPSQEYWIASCPRVPQGTVFVLGDNLDRSQDSRDWGFVPLANVVGRSLF